ncbi:hypothetical protein C0J52_07767 [Blattella germanica]|nr:hypothetical protein C0J52_07767 [Blattella germanica]
MAEGLLETRESEGETVQFFRVRMRGVFRQYVESMSVEEFNRIYGEFFQGKKSTGKRLYKRLQSETLNMMFDELDEIIVEERFDEKLKTSLTKCQDNKAIAWRPPGNPEEHMRSLDIHEKLKIKKELESLVEEREAAVQKLMAEVKAGRSHALHLETKLATAIDRMKNTCIEEKNKQSVLEAKWKLLTKEVKLDC